MDISAITRGISRMIRARGVSQTARMIMLEVTANRLWIKRRGIECELLYWEKQASGLGDSSKQFESRANPESDVRHYPRLLDQYFNEFLDEQGRAPEVLDIGSGPISTLFKAHDRGAISLTISDILADEYKQLLQDYGFPTALLAVPCVSCRAEELHGACAGKQFDITHCSNALDHTDSPSRSLAQICEVTRSGGLIIVYGNMREGSHEGWDGIHMHDLFVEDGSLFREGKEGERSNISAGLPMVCCFSEVFDRGSLQEMIIIFRQM